MKPSIKLSRLHPQYPRVSQNPRWKKKTPKIHSMNIRQVLFSCDGCVWFWWSAKKCSPQKRFTWFIQELCSIVGFQAFFGIHMGGSHDIAVLTLPINDSLKVTVTWIMIHQSLFTSNYWWSMNDSPNLHEWPMVNLDIHPRIELTALTLAASGLGLKPGCSYTVIVSWVRVGSETIFQRRKDHQGWPWHISPWWSFEVSSHDQVNRGWVGCISRLLAHVGWWVVG